MARKELDTDEPTEADLDAPIVGDPEEVKAAKEILGMWGDLRIEVETIDRDMYKSLVRGNTAAGRRSRAKFRALKKAAADIVREMVKLDKARASKKKTKKTEAGK